MPEDDLITCAACRRLDAANRCKATLPNGAVHYLCTVIDLPRRCEDFIPAPDADDPRTGAQRWPGMHHPGMAGLGNWMPEEKRA